MQGEAIRRGHQKPHVNLRQKNGMKVDLVEHFYLTESLLSLYANM